MINKGPYLLEHDAVRWRLEEVIQMTLLEKAKPPAIGGCDHLAGALDEVSPGAFGLIEDVAGFKGLGERLDIGFWPVLHGQVLELAHHATPFLPLRLACLLRLSFSASRCRNRCSP